MQLEDLNIPHSAVPESTGPAQAIVRSVFDADFSEYGHKFRAAFNDQAVLAQFGQLRQKRFICSIDLELTCEKREEVTGPNYRSWQEIIEIGLVITEAKSGIERRRISKLVRPTERPILSDYCTTLTGITQADVDSAKPLIETWKELSAFIPDNKSTVFASFGRDPEWLIAELLRKSSKHTLPLDPRFIDVKFFDLLERGKNSHGLLNALDARKIKPDSNSHRALPDAVAVSELVRVMKLHPTNAFSSETVTFKERMKAVQNQRVSEVIKSLGISRTKAGELLKSNSWNVQNVLMRSKHERKH